MSLMNLQTHGIVHTQVIIKSLPRKMPVNVSLSLLTTILLILKFTSLNGYNKTCALAAKPRFNDRALLARCSGHIQSTAVKKAIR